MFVVDKFEVHYMQSRKYVNLFTECMVHILQLFQEKRQHAITFQEDNAYNAFDDTDDDDEWQMCSSKRKV